MVISEAWMFEISIGLKLNGKEKVTQFLTFRKNRNQHRPDTVANANKIACAEGERTEGFQGFTWSLHHYIKFNTDVINDYEHQKI